MSDKKPVPGTTTATTTQTETQTRRKIVRRAFGDTRTSPQKLTAKEEQVLRMRYGIAAGPDMELEFEGQNNEQLKAELARMEARALEMIARGHGRARQAPEPRKDSTKARIIEKLRDL